MAAAERLDEWQMCAQWFVRCRILPDDHKATHRNAKAFDLAQALRDGVLICHLLNHLSPNCVDQKDFSPRPQMSQFLCLKNIRTFLHTCKRVFGLRDGDLFEPLDLFDVKDFRKVLGTLSKLSRTDLAIKKNSGFCAVVSKPEHDYYNILEDLATGFPPSTVAIPQAHNYDDDDEDIYGNLKDMAFENDLSDNDDLYDTVYHEDDIYQDLCSTRKPKQRGGRDSTPLTKRDMCLKELLETEKNYVAALNMIVQHFIHPLSRYFQPHEKEVIFAHIERLQEVHSGFFAELTQATTIGIPKLHEVFIRWKTHLLVYGEFCSNLPKAQEAIEEACRKNETLRLKIEECQKKANDGKFRLRDLLSVPMQRVLKYHLLLKELIKQTDEMDEDKKGLQQALEAMMDLSLYVNEVKRDNEALQLIGEIQQSIVDLQMPPKTTLKDYGRLQKDGELKIRSHVDNRVKQRYIFLFDKVMLMCKSRGETYSYKEAIALAEFKVDENVSGRDQLRKTDKWNCSFIMVQNNQKFAYTFFAKTEEMRKKWIEAIKLALENTQPSSNTGFVMHTFDTPRECDICGKLLRGVFYQGYFCHETKKAVHKECIGKSPKDKIPQVPPRLSEPIAQVRGRCSYSGVPNPGEGRIPLKFNQDQVIEVLAKVQTDWWKGRIGTEEGYFPSHLVRDVGQPPLKRKPSYVETHPERKDIFNGAITSPTPCIQRTGYINVEEPDLNKFPWYVGELDRDAAAKTLESQENGTYMIRASQNPQRMGELSLSIRFTNAIRHIKVNRAPDSTYYLADCKYFHNLVELVEYYQQNTLSASFPELETRLLYPIKKEASANGSVKLPPIAQVVYDYSATATNQLTLHRGESVSIISKAGGDKGWWKGELKGKVGYFPLAYVVEDEDE